MYAAHRHKQNISYKHINMNINRPLTKNKNKCMNFSDDKSMLNINPNCTILLQFVRIYFKDSGFAIGKFLKNVFFLK